MISILDKYIARHVLQAVLLALLVLLGLDLLFAFLDELDELGEAYTLEVIAHYLWLTLPARLYELLPISAMLGALIGLGVLAGSSELTVMRAAGISLWRIARAVMQPTLLLMLLVMLVGEWWVPQSAPQANSIRAVALGKQDELASRYGVWHREGNTFIHFNAVDSRGLIYGVSRYQFDEQQRLVSSSYAEQAQYQDGQWLLSQVREAKLETVEPPRWQAQQREQEPWQTELTPELLNLVVLDPLYLPMPGLWQYANYLQEQGLEADRYWLAFWQKMLQPLAVAALVLVGMSFVFGPLRSVSMGQRVISGVIVGVAFRLAQDLLGPVVTLSGISPLLAVLGLLVLCLGLGSWLLKRVR
ncbi:LPS export ABC transporter permease LptG [Balneatrix alpica]|uniref:LPS export ABC transporter permease LptG n=1 Tax=Balneatrix alpica TaxID=75684 RepID=A0ABV5ZC09_9GAMM|nr:LPS export ABC transporter permease LptG [Balneatrix alpica]